jgi:ribosomal-protein-alanine N-acetyltransferase
MIRPTELHTERLLLRPFCAGDVADALAYRNDPEFARFLPHVPQPFTWGDAEAFVARNVAESWETSSVFAVVLGGTVIGTVNFEVDRARRAAMLGYALGRRWWGCGFATEAARGGMAWAVGAYGLRRVWASTDVRTVPSRRVMEKLGMRCEGVRVADHIGRDGAIVDEVVYGMEVGGTDIVREITIPLAT